MNKLVAALRYRGTPFAPPAWIRRTDIAERLLTPSKITAWLDCAHYLWLRDQVDSGLLDPPPSTFSAFAQLLLDKGLSHEHACLADYREQGKSVLEVPGRADRESFAAWTARIGNPFDDGCDVVYQMPFVHDGVRGIADFVIRVVDPGTGAVCYEPVDAKLARTEAKPGHVLQLCFYADAIEALTGTRPQRMHLWLGSGRIESLRVDDFSPYWRRLRGQLTRALAAGPGTDTVPQPCPHCEFCEFNPLCEAGWRAEDSLIFVAGIGQSDIAALDEVDVHTLAQLAEHTEPVRTIRAARLDRLLGQAALQVQARLVSAAPPPFTVIAAGDDPVWGRGFEQLPKPDEGDVFIDFEGHPFWRADVGLFFLFGALQRDADRQWRYRSWWAHDRDQEAAAVEQFVDYLTQRREQFPDMHAYHYNHTERSSLESLTQTHCVAQSELAELVETGFFVDLLVVARNSIQAGTESYGLKSLERLTDFQRSHDIDQGAGAVLQYERFMADGDTGELDSIAVYNEDDVRATMALRDWLIDQRPADTVWRASGLEPGRGTPELDEQVTRLHEFDPGTAEHFLGYVLGYWHRERLAYLAPKIAQLQGDSACLLDDPDVITGLRPIGLVERHGKRGKLKYPGMRFAFPPQELNGWPPHGGAAMFLDPDGAPQYPVVDRLDLDAGELDLVWNEEFQKFAHTPNSVVMNDWVSPKPKPEVLSEFADTILDGGGVNPVTLALLRRDPPGFIPGGGPRGGRFTDDLDDMTRWVNDLDAGCAAVQGPPGTGKTYSAAHLVHALIVNGKRVGITATSHVAIDNVLREVLRVFADNGDTDLLSAVRKPDSGGTQSVDGITYRGDNKACAKSKYNLVAGTTWLFASPAMRNCPVDVLLIDEAGQLSLADALAASTSAGNLVLLGDPLQLPQVAQAVHPEGSGRSVLEHILGDEVTMPGDRGVFLSQTRRMHPDVCAFISDEIYEGRLVSHSDCERQSTVAGTGLRWLIADHQGCGTSCPQEADLIAEEIARLIGTPWTNFKGEQNPLAASDFMVVAPFNDQVRTIVDRLGRDERTRDVPVGTVDKFQGRQAAVVFFSMTTSSGDELTRGADFLFSRNRLNVAISRARCLAYLVCTDALLDTRARTVEDMRLVGTLNAFVERAQHGMPDSVS